MINFDPFRFETHSRSGFTIYLFEKEHLKKDSKLANQIVSYCESIQDQVWTKKFETAHNSVEQDILLLAWDKKSQQPVGFFSASFIEQPDSTLFIYHSDGMVLEKHWGKGLLSNFFKITNQFVAKKHKRSKIINIVATGCLYVFSCFEGKKQYSRVQWPLDSKTMDSVKEILKQSFMNLPIDKNGVIKLAWRKQNNGMKNVWSAEIADKLGFPQDVNYFNGDVLVRLYEFSKSEKVDCEI